MLPAAARDVAFAMSPAARAASTSMEPDELGTALGITGDQAQELLDRYRRL
ncbi:hypothetical protein [Streptomyces sp. NBC_00354]|uniref:hypothetical protein n=1 Tax=Streptomyces sp. NBC_00354 TaxID=2975723 RepID=UPI002E274640|nr:hypothetical protein OG296_40635 [Streptomyces sp. NBC_01001]